jgi:acetyl-CoA carboxylase carboxyltransferase component
LPRHAARIPLALSTVRVPICTFVVGRCPGIAQLLIGGVGRMMDLFYYAMWPTARFEGLGIRREDDAGDALTVAERFGVDEVLDPGLTRQRLLDVIAAAPVVPRREVPHQIDNW